MDLKSGYPFWAIKNGLMHAFPQLRDDLRCDVAVIGGGITGALVADELLRHGHDVALFEQRDIGWGSTAASTALVQYEIDTHLADLARLHGEADAVLAYRACVEGVERVADRARTIGDVGFRPMQSLYCASRRWHVRGLRREFELRLRHGLPVEWLDAGAVEERYGFHAHAAILSGTAAVLDPYRMTCRLLQDCERRGMPVFDRSCMTLATLRPRSVELRFANGCRVRARHTIMATGYAAQRLLHERVARNRSSYAFVTDPLEAGALGALEANMTWETARPYLYARATTDARLMVGGGDDAIDIPARRDARVMKKALRLAERAADLLPGSRIVPAFAWAGTFAETADGLPFFGMHPQHGPRLLFAMAYGGNGITYSMLGAGVLRAAIERRRHPLSALFGFARMRA